MKQKIYISIKIDSSFLRRYFDIDYFPKSGEYKIQEVYYDMVKNLLSEYDVKDQYYIDNFCYLERNLWGQWHWANEQKSNDDEEAWRKYLLDLAKFGEFLEENKITAIKFQGENQMKYAVSQTFNDHQFIYEIISRLSRLISEAKRRKESGHFEDAKRRPGREISIIGYYIRIVFKNLIDLLHDSPFPKLKNLSEPEENLFVGRFFSIAGIIKPFHHELNDRAGYKNEKDYLIKRMQKYRLKLNPGNS